MKRKRGIANLYLIPSILSEEGIDSIPDAAKLAAFRLKDFVVENERNARRYLIKLGYQGNISDIRFYIWNKQSKLQEWEVIQDLMESGVDLGIITDAGCPGIADPGADIVSEAHRRGIRVIPLAGPSSILMALMASGMNGQSFAFNGYLPIENNLRTKAIKELESRSFRYVQTQIFMETPYRNHALLQALLKVCHPETLLCIACNINAKDELIKTMTIREWSARIDEFNFKKKPAIFLLEKMNT